MEKSEVRKPAVAGKFYPRDPETLKRELDECLAAESTIAEDALGCIVPHAGYMYSGYVAGAVYRKLPPRHSYVVLGPNHFGMGEPLAIDRRGTWMTPLGEIAIDESLAESVMSACPALSDDQVAHFSEHSLEVQLPFLQYLHKQFRFVPIAVGVGSYEPLEALGHGVARAVKAAGEPVMIVASSDMNHYQPDSVTRIKDRKAIDKILEFDPRGLYSVLDRERITMCGFGPAIALLVAAQDLGATWAELVKYETSADRGGDREAVVGYAGIVISK